MTKKQLGIGIAIFIAGLILSPKGGSTQAPVAAPTGDVIAKEQMVKLRDTDNKVFVLAGSAMTACSDMLMAVQEGDIEKLNSQTDLLESMAESVTVIKTDRDAILTEAGIPNK